MSASDGASAGDGTLAGTPEYELSCLFDDTDDPSEVTVFSPVGERTVTEWITADLATSVPLDQAR